MLLLKRKAPAPGLAPIAAGDGAPHQARYNLSSIMLGARYALVAYVRKPVGEFVEKLRKELHPELPHLAAHLTILPPRRLQGSEADAIRDLEAACRDAEPFEVTLGEVETSPARDSHSVYPRGPCRFSHAGPPRSAQSCRGLLHRGTALYSGTLTIAKMGTEELAWKAFDVARKRWSRYSGTRHIALEELTFVREDVPNCWIDLAPVPLGRSLVSRKK